MPTTPWCQLELASTMASRGLLPVQHFLGLAVNLQLNVLPLLIEAAQPAGHFLAPAGSWVKNRSMARSISPSARQH